MFNNNDYFLCNKSDTSEDFTKDEVKSFFVVSLHPLEVTKCQPVEYSINTTWSIAFDFYC